MNSVTCQALADRHIERPALRSTGAGAGGCCALTHDAQSRADSRTGNAQNPIASRQLSEVPASGTATPRRQRRKAAHHCGIGPRRKRNTTRKITFDDRRHENVADCDGTSDNERAYPEIGEKPGSDLTTVPSVSTRRATKTVLVRIRLAQLKWVRPNLIFRVRFWRSRGGSWTSSVP